MEWIISIAVIAVLVLFVVFSFKSEKFNAITSGVIAAITVLLVIVFLSEGDEDATQMIIALMSGVWLTYRLLPIIKFCGDDLSDVDSYLFMGKVVEEHLPYSGAKAVVMAILTLVQIIPLICVGIYYLVGLWVGIAPILAVAYAIVSIIAWTRSN